MKKRYIQLFVVALLVLFITLVINNTSRFSNLIKKNINPAENISNIEIDFKIHNNKDNSILENTIDLPKDNINKIYYSKKYDKYEFILCLDINNIIHVAYSYNDTYKSICQITNAINDDQYIYESSKSNNIIDFENVLGYSGVKFTFLTGAASNNICYIAITDKPFLLLSESLGGDFTEYDIDKDGQKELMSFDGYMYIKDNNEIYKAIYNLDKSTTKQIIFNENTYQYEVFLNDGTQKIYNYDSEKKYLIEQNKRKA